MKLIRNIIAFFRNLGGFVESTVLPSKNHINLIQSYAVPTPPEVNWDDFFKRDPSTITEAEWTVAGHAAGSWPTCACGVACKALPRDDDGSPSDLSLKGLGFQFYYAIRAKDQRAARTLFALIESRSSQLIALSQ